MPGYVPVTIDNHVCVGACFSYSIPSSEPAEPGELIRPYCDSCQPVRTRCFHVTLQRDTAVGSEEQTAQPPDTAQKRVQIIDDCACLKCNGEPAAADCDAAEQRTSELPEQLLSERRHGAPEPPEEAPLAGELPPPSPPPVVNASSALDALLESDVGDSASQDLLEDGDGSEDGPLRELLLARHRHWGLGAGGGGAGVGNALDGPAHEGRLARGPHGSLVLVPERLTVDERDMRPAHEGTVISYHEHNQPAVHPTPSITEK